MTTPADLSTLPPATPAPRAGRGRKPGSKAKQRAQLPPEAFIIEDVPELERGPARRKRIERDAQQLSIDARVLAVYQEWLSMGKPTDWLKMPVKYWRIEKRYAEDAQFFLSKATQLIGKKLIIGDVKAIPKSSPPVVRIPFCVVDRPEKDDETE